MKSTINKLFTLCLISLVLFSCEKEEERLVLRPGAVPTLASTANSVELAAENKAEDAITLNWTAADYGFQAAVTYTLQFIAEGGDFAEAREVETTPGMLSKTLTVAELNTLATQLGLAPNNEGTMQVRVKSSVAESVTPTHSNVVSIKVTPFLDIIEYVSLWVPGSHQGWDPAKAPKVSSVNDNGVYEGYVNFPDAKTNFKLNPAPNWDNDFGGTSSGNKGTLVAKGTDLQVDGAGYYLLKANTNQLTWEAVKTTWGVIGDATGSWDNDQDMTYDATAQVWKATLQLSVGEIKFRANDKWDINFGDDNADASLEYGAANIKVTEAGRYEVVLNLANPGNYTYTLTKL
ncbi:SusE domain-containing protein [Pontibacter sp. BT731]|uniref:SusE domain-containing protein n=1 Tax=Pontibacter coccineus TaxID=3063328 RepID=UPI0026E17D5A|nr:SusE domain-containing protein [Pontibacter sp. BT731]MDO6388822.1 SusE domain-containing protein [Pontibacter sp. BT731]